MESPIEYVIWGVPPGGTDEVVLVSNAVTPERAKNVKASLESKHGCTAVRIQRLDLSVPPDFRKCIAR